MSTNNGNNAATKMSLNKSVYHRVFLLYNFCFASAKYY
uniref:MIP14754p n=1 Tax=Drosophila melanogaster TaxID=7227 RepID=C9QPD8_DROME|nr:MIP14754p [Drosophila melanogaster]